jgi:SAM-dependent methyltransferase
MNSAAGTTGGTGGHDPAEYGERIGGRYDEWYGAREDRGPVVRFLVAQAAGRPALELGIGTGRIAVPLAAQGIEVDGIDASPRMVAQLRAKPAGADMAVSIGDMADVSAPGGPYGLVYVVFNTFFMLLTQEDQVRCFANVAAHLMPGGAFVMEVFVPEPSRFSEGQLVRVDRLDEGMDRFTASLHDPVSQQIRSRHFVIGTAGVEAFPIDMRYAYPAELDLMARLAGMQLTARWGGWHGQPFTAASGQHVSVWQLPRG